MPRVPRATLLETLNRPGEWDDDVTIRFTWQEVTIIGCRSWALVAIVEWAAAETGAYFLVAGDTVPDLPPGLYPFGATIEQLATARAFVEKYEADGAIDFIDAAGRALTKRTVPADEVRRRVFPPEMLSLVTH